MNHTYGTWYDIESAPKDRAILLWWPGAKAVREGCYSDKEARFFNTGNQHWWRGTRLVRSAYLRGFDIEPTQWMPLPQPPDQKEGE